MKRFIVLAIALALFVPTVGGAAMAKTAVRHAAVLKCPACGMMMATTKSAGAPVPVKIDGKVYYCCAGCAMGSKAAAYYKKNHKPMVVTAAAAKSKKSAKMSGKM